MKKYFQLLTEGFVLGMRNPKGDKKPEILAPGIMPVGKFIIHPKTNKIMLADPAFPDALHTSIALNYGFDNVSDAQSKGWVRGSYTKPNRMGGNGLLELEGYHGHEDLRKLLSRLFDVIPNNVDFMVDNYDREEAKTDSKNFTGTEALNQYINGGTINPIVAPTSTSTRTDYEVEKQLRKTVPKWQMPAESFTFSKLRTQLNEEHKDLIDEISPVMWIHKDSIYEGGLEDSHDHNSLAQMILSDYGKRPEGNYSDQVLGLGGWTRLMKVGKTQFEIESASHEALRDTLGRIEPHLAGHKVHLEVRDPNNVDPAHIWSRNVNAEQLRHYIKHGHQARSLRVESWQEYHTNKKFLVEEKVESFVASGMKRHPLYSEDSVQPNEAQPPRGPRKKQLSEFEDFLRTIHPYVNSKHEKDFVINNHVQLIPQWISMNANYVGHHGTEDIEMLKEMLKHQRILVERGISKPEDIGTSTLGKISALHDQHEDILLPIKRATSTQGLAPYKIGRIEHPTKEGEHLDVHLMRNITDDKEADRIAKNVKMACPAGSKICIQHRGQYVQDYSRGHGLLVFTNPKSGGVEFAHGHNDGFRTHKNDRVEKNVYDKIVNNIFKLNSPKMTPYLLEHGSPDQVHPLISKMLSQNNVNDLTEDDQRTIVKKGNDSHINELLKRQKLSGEVQDLIRDKGNDSHRNALSERPDRISLDNPSSHEYIANHRGDDQLEKLLDHPQLDPKLIRTIHNRIESPRIQLKLLKGDTVDIGNRERYEVNIVTKLREEARANRFPAVQGIDHSNVIDQLLELPSITGMGQQNMIHRPYHGGEGGVLTPEQLTKLMSRSDFAQSAHGVVAEHGSDWHRTQLLKRKDFSVNAHARMAQYGNYDHIAELLKRSDLDINAHKWIATATPQPRGVRSQSPGDEAFQRNLITLANRQDLNPEAHYNIAKYGNDAAHAALLNRSDIQPDALNLIKTFFGNNVNKDRARVLTSYRKQMLDAGQTAKDNSSIKESWQEYDAKVGETNTSLFEPGNTKFNMKAFLKKLRKKNGVRVNLPGEN